MPAEILGRQNATTQHSSWNFSLKWAVTDKFKDYLYGAKFVVYTDNNPLTYVLSTAKLDATGHRWLAAFGAFDFSIKYEPGIRNVDADMISFLDSHTVLRHHRKKSCLPILYTQSVED